MSLLDRLKDGVTNQATMLSVADTSNRGINGASLVGFGVDKAERYVAAGAFGYVKGKYREKSLIGGKVPVDLLAGGVLTLLAAGLNITSDGRSVLAKHAERVGDAGVMSFFNSLGASWGAHSAGYQVAVLPKTAALPAGSSPMVLGNLPEAQGGAFLTAEEIAKFSAPK